MRMVKEIYGLECRNFNDMNNLCTGLLAMPRLLSSSYHDLGAKVLKIRLSELPYRKEIFFFRKWGDGYLSLDVIEEAAREEGYVMPTIGNKLLKNPDHRSCESA